MAGKPGEAALAFDAALGHIAPIAALIEQGESSYRRAARALAAGRFEEAPQPGRYTVEEAREGQELYAAWRDQTRRYLLREGVAEKVVAAEQARLAGLLRLDDGAPFDADQRWAEFKGLIDDFVFSCGAGNATRAGEQLEAARLSWRDTHDRACDWVYGLQDAVVRHLGEARGHGCPGDREQDRRENGDAVLSGVCEDQKTCDDHQRSDHPDGLASICVRQRPT